MRASLLININSQTSTVELEEAVPCRIGRAPSNTIPLDGQLVSRNHAMVQASDGGIYQVFDLGSRNGTFLNGRRITAPSDLRDGDYITVGGFEMTFLSGASMTAPVDAQSDVSSRTFADLSVKEITVVVTDVRGFTTLCQVIGALRMAEIVQAMNEESGAALERLRPGSIKYIGDATMAFWVQGDVKANHVITALCAVADLFAVAASMQRRFCLSSPILIGAAVDVGLASVGNIGSDSAGDFTAMGDVVNRAFRLEAASRDLSVDLVLSSEAVHVGGGASRFADWTQPKQASLKGFTGQTNVHTSSREDLRRFLSSLPNESMEPAIK